MGIGPVVNPALAALFFKVGDEEVHQDFRKEIGEEKTHDAFQSFKTADEAERNLNISPSIIDSELLMFDNGEKMFFNIFFERDKVKKKRPAEVGRQIDEGG